MNFDFPFRSPFSMFSDWQLHLTVVIRILGYCYGKCWFRDGHDEVLSSFPEGRGVTSLSVPGGRASINVPNSLVHWRISHGGGNISPPNNQFSGRNWTKCAQSSPQISHFFKAKNIKYCVKWTKCQTFIFHPLFRLFLHSFCYCFTSCAVSCACFSPS